MTPDERLEDLLATATELPAADRSAYLDRECGDDHHLRGRVEQLLRSLMLATAEGFLSAAAPVLALGRQLGRYKLLRVVGVGSTGTVYEARHLALGRRCAVKVLHPALVANAEARERFCREVRALGELRHPNVIGGTDAHTAGPPFYIVTEYLDGVSVRDALRAVPRFPVGVAVEVLRQAADGLAALAAKALVHRDLSPSNLFLTAEGVVKLLDLGLVRGERPEDWLTNPVSLLGNPAYMAPEQYDRPGHADARSDLYALGCVGYQLLAGHVPFADQGGLVRADFPRRHAHDSPTPLGTIRPETPPAVAAVVMRLLAKAPADRPQTPADVRDQLRAAGGGGVAEFVASIPRTPEAADEPTTLVPRGRRTRLRRAAYACAAAVAAVGLFVVARRDREPVWEPVPLTSAVGREVTPCFSRDGRAIAYAWGGADGRNIDIYVKQSADAGPRRVSSHPAVELSPAWGPDDRAIAFWREGTDANAYDLVRVSLDDGREETLLHVEGVVQQLDWSPDGRWLTFAVLRSRRLAPGLYAWDAVDRRLDCVIATPDGWHDSRPRLSPAGTEIAFVRKRATYSDDQRLCVVPRDGRSEPRVVWQALGYFNGIDWTPDGSELVFAFDRSARSRLWRVPTTGGTPTEVRLPIDARATAPTLARRGRRLAFAAVADEWTVWRQRLVGPDEPLPPAENLFATNRSDDAPAYSPDGRQIAFSSDRSGTAEIWLYDVATATTRPLTDFRGPEVGSPQWHPDGRRIIFDSTRDGPSGIYTLDLRRPFGSFDRVPTPGAVPALLPSWSADGRWVLFQTHTKGDGDVVQKMPAAGGPVVPLTTAPSTFARSTPDGTRVAYLGEGNRVRLVSADGGPAEVLPGHRYEWNCWAVGRRGIYSLSYPQTPAGEIRYATFDSTPSRLVGRYRAEHVYVNGRYPGGRIAVSPDERELLLVEYSRDGSSIRLVEDFR